MIYRISVINSILILFACFSLFAQEKTSLLVIKSESGIYAFIDNIFKGKTNADSDVLLIENIPIGTHVLKFTHGKLYLYEEEITIYKNIENIYNFNGFVTGCLLVISNNENLQINIERFELSDFKPINNKMLVSDIPVGSYTCEFKGTDTTLLYEIDIRNEDTLKLFVNLVSGQVNNLSDVSKDFEILEYGTFVDNRDKQEYRWVKIGEQIWMSDNLNIGSMIPLRREMSDNGIIEKYCYKEEESNCSFYGGLYQWNEAMQYNSKQVVKGTCPEGWHIPSKGDWDILFKNRYKSENKKYLLFPLAGHRYPKEFSISNIRYRNAMAFIWSSDLFFLTYYMNPQPIHKYKFEKINKRRKKYGFSVKCIKDKFDYR